MKNLLLLTTIILFVVMSGSIDAQWFAQNNPSQNSYLLDIFALDENTAIAVGGNSSGGIILKTTDGGENWLNIPQDTINWLNSVYFVNDSIGWIVGPWQGYSAGVIQKTTDGGNNWISQFSWGGCCFSLNSVHFVDENTGWAVGSIGEQPKLGGIMYKTTDGGINWIEQSPGIFVASWSSVFFININTGWVGGGALFFGDRIAKTTDSRETWLDQSIGVNNWLSDVYFINENIGWTVSSGGSIFKTTDGGENWINQPSGFNDNLSSIQFVNPSTGWAVGENGTILNTTDGSINWINQLSGTSSDLYSVHFADENTGWAVGANGTILKTINGGTPVELTSFNAIAQSGYVELNWTTATELNNQGFEIQRSTVTSEFVTVGFVEGNGTTTEEHQYSFKDKDVSGFLRYRLKQVDFDGSYEYSDIIEVEVLGNISYELAQNYPNPFNPITNISYTLPTESQVKLSVYNPLGELVETIVNEKQDAGKYDAVWNASNHPSGVYIYSLDAVSLNGSKLMKISKKMILMK